MPMPPASHPNGGITIVIASYLEPEHVKEIRAVDRRLDVRYEPDLLRPPRYAADHTGADFIRDPDQERRWQFLLRDAQVLFDFDVTHRHDLPDLAPNVKWIQGTSSGIGQLVSNFGYDKRMPNTVFTTASGIHTQTLAEFCMMSMLIYSRDLFKLQQNQSQKQWERYAATDLADRQLVVVGLGKIGRRVAEIATAFGMKVVGIKRTVSETDLASPNVHAVYPTSLMHTVLGNAQYLVLAAPHTSETESMIGENELNMLPHGAILINIARGALLDEEALINALNSGHLGGAALDVFTNEPLPKASPLWNMPNVIISPHSGSTSDRENSRLTTLFCQNLRLYLNGDTLINELDTERLY